MSDELLSLFGFRTGIPCGYLLFFLFGLFWCFVAVVVLIVGLVRRKALLIALPCLFLLGTWRTEGSSLTLRADGAYELRAGNDFAKDFGTSASSGAWRHGASFAVDLIDRSGRKLPALRVISFRKKPRLIMQFDDPDDWDGDWGFRKSAAAPR